MRATAIAGSPRLLPLFGGSSQQGNSKGKTVQLYTKVFTSPSGVTIYRNSNALPRAYLVEKVRPVEGSMRLDFFILPVPLKPVL